MPLPGIGVAPAAGNVYNELAAVTRRAFLPRLVTQIYFSAPSAYYMLGNAQRAAGGLNQITIPVQGQSMVQGQFVGWGGGFNSPTVIPGIQNFQFNLAYWVVPIPLPFGETVIQATDREISILKARMNDAYMVTRQNIARLMFTNNTGNTQMPDSFLNAFDDGTNFPTYGGVSRTAAGNSAFQGQYINMATNFTGYSVSTVGFTRKSMAALLTRVTDAAGGESPTAVLMNPSDFATLNADFIGIEQIHVAPGKEYGDETRAYSAFPNLRVSNVPIFADHFCPKGTVVGFNSKYTNFYLSEDAAFDFSGFQSLIPLGQIGQQGVVILGYNLVSAKPSSGFVAYNVGGGAY